MCKTCSPPRCSEQDSYSFTMYAEYGHRPQILTLHMRGENRSKDVPLPIVTLTIYGVTERRNSVEPCYRARRFCHRSIGLLGRSCILPKLGPYIFYLPRVVTSSRLSSSSTVLSSTVVPYIMTWRPGVDRRLVGVSSCVVSSSDMDVLS